MRMTRERKEAKRGELEKICRAREKIAGAQEQTIVMETSTILCNEVSGLNSSELCRARLTWR